MANYAIVSSPDNSVANIIVADTKETAEMMFGGFLVIELDENTQVNLYDLYDEKTGKFTPKPIIDAEVVEPTKALE